MAPPPKPPGGLTFGGRTYTPRQLAVIRARNLANPPTGQSPSSLQAISPSESAALRFAGKGSGVIDPTRTATDPAVVQKLRGEFGDPGVSGYNLARSLVGKNAAAYVPGTRPPLGFHPSPLKAAAGVATLFPLVRGADAAVTAARVIRAGEGGSAALAAGRTAMRGYGPTARLEGRLGQRYRQEVAQSGPLERVVHKSLPAYWFLRPRPPLGVPNQAVRQIGAATNRVVANNQRQARADVRAWAAREKAARLQARILGPPAPPGR